MNKLRFLLPLLAVFAFSSCDNFTEEVRINADGSGTYSCYMDMIPAISKMATQMQGMFSAFDSTASGDSLLSEAALQEKIWEDFPDVIDSVFEYTDLPDSVLEDPENKRILGKLRGFMEGGRSKGYVNTGVRYPFDNFADLQHFMRKMEENQQQGNGAGGIVNGLNNVKTETKYEMKNNVVTRKITYLQKPEVSDKDMASMKMFMGEAKMRTVLHLPRKVKSARGTGFLKKEDNTVVFEYDFMDYFTGKISGDFEVVME